MAWLILWVLAFLFVATGTVISAIVAFLVKGKWQTTCVDVLLVFATLVVLVGFSSVFFPKEITEKQTTKLSESARISQADKDANGLIALEYTEQLTDPLKSIVSFDEMPSLKKETAKVLESVKTLSNSYPNDASLAARLAILTKTSADPKPVFEHYARSGGTTTPLFSALNRLYLEPKSFKSPADVLAIKTSLPSGWYKQTALAEAYKLTGDQLLKDDIETREKKSNSWRTKFAICQIFKLIAALCGIVVIIATLKARPNNTDFVPLTLSFRRVYAVLLSSLYAQMVCSITAGFFIGMATALHMGAQTVASQRSMLEIASETGGVIAATLSFYFLICRPNKISMLQAFMRGNQITNAKKFATLAAAGFAAMVSVNYFIRMLRNLLPDPPTSVSNTAQLSMIDAFTNLNYPAICWSVFIIVVVAPICEEILFRGILYGWLRQRFGFKIAIVLGALLFAGYHFDLVGFWQYFGIGLILSTTYERTRSLLLTTIIHGLWNGWIIFATAALIAR